jgi:hypothetical protein
MQYAVCSMQYAVCSMQYAVCSMQYAVCSMHLKQSSRKVFCPNWKLLQIGNLPKNRIGNLLKIGNLFPESADCSQSANILLNIGLFDATLTLLLRYSDATLTLHWRYYDASLRLQDFDYEIDIIFHTRLVISCIFFTFFQSADWAKPWNVSILFIHSVTL